VILDSQEQPVVPDSQDVAAGADSEAYDPFAELVFSQADAPDDFAGRQLVDAQSASEEKEAPPAVHLQRSHDAFTGQ
jgi:hypothetical protein